MNSGHRSRHADTAGEPYHRAGVDPVSRRGIDWLVNAPARARGRPPRSSPRRARDRCARTGGRCMPCESSSSGRRRPSAPNAIDPFPFDAVVGHLDSLDAEWRDGVQCRRRREARRAPPTHRAGRDGRRRGPALRSSSAPFEHGGRLRAVGHRDRAHRAAEPLPDPLRSPPRSLGPAGGDDRRQRRPWQAGRRRAHPTGPCPR